MLLFPAGRVRAGGGDVLGAEDVTQWAEEACPLASALGPLLSATGPTEVEVTKKVASIRVGDEAELRFSIRAGDDMDAMRDTLLGSCVRSPGIVGVSNVRVDLRGAFDGADPLARGAALKKAVDALRTQYTELARVLPEAEAACGAPRPVLPRATPAPTSLAAIRTYLKAVTDADAAIAAAADGCRTVDRARGMVPELVTGSGEQRRKVREDAATSAARIAEARTNLTPKMVDFVVTGSGGTNPWSMLADTVRSATRAPLEACSDPASSCDASLDVAVCDKVAAAIADKHAALERDIVAQELHPYVGGAAWCTGAAGRPVCDAAYDRFLSHGKEVIRQSCRDVYLKGDGPSLVQAAQARKEADVARAFQTLRQLGDAFGAMGAYSSASTGKTCRTIYTCTCLDDHRQITRSNKCPDLDGMGCNNWTTDDKREECN